MPLVQIKVFENELPEAKTQEMIQKVTDVMVSFTGGNLRQAIWITTQEVKSSHWGVRGKALRLDDIRAIRTGRTNP